MQDVTIERPTPAHMLSLIDYYVCDMSKSTGRECGTAGWWTNG